MSTLTDSTASNPSKEDLIDVSELNDDDVASECDSKDHENSFLTVSKRAAIASAKRLKKKSCYLRNAMYTISGERLLHAIMLHYPSFFLSR